MPALPTATMKTLFLATFFWSAQSSACQAEDHTKCAYGTSLLQVSANPETGALLDIDSAQDPAKASAKEDGDAKPVANETTPDPAGEAAKGSTDSPNSTTNVNATNATNITNATNTTNTTNANATEITPVPTGCAVKDDPRAKAWFAETSPEGTPCVFGVDGDARDEGAHCIFDNGDFGTNGWCYTSKDRSSWGSCNGKCPLYGPSKQLGKKIDHMDKMVDKVIKKLDDKGTTAVNSSSNSENEVTEEAPKATKGPKAPADGAKEVDAGKKQEKSDGAKENF